MVYMLCFISKTQLRGDRAVGTATKTQAISYRATKATSNTNNVNITHNNNNDNNDKLS